MITGKKTDGPPIIMTGSLAGAKPSNKIG